MVHGKNYQVMGSRNAGSSSKTVQSLTWPVTRLLS